jgi:hypothetical protein
MLRQKFRQARDALGDPPRPCPTRTHKMKNERLETDQALRRVALMGAQPSAR